MSAERKRVWIIDCIKAVMIIFVIVNHSNVFDKDNPFFLLFINPAVPIFMALSGYVFAASCSRKSLKEMYAFPRIRKQFLRYFFPMMLTLILWVLFEIIIKHLKLGPLMKKLLLADYGQGSYYFYLLVGLIFIMPILLVIVKKYMFLGLLCIGLATAGYEFICHSVNLGVGVYRILVFRYMFHIGGGMIIFLIVDNHRNKQNDCVGKLDVIMSILSMLVGAVYLCLPSFGYSYRFFSYPVWGRTSMITAFWILPFLYWILKLCWSKDCKGMIGNIISLIGRSSYHIMYSQMIIYIPLYYKFDQMHMLSLSKRILALILIAAASCLIGIVWKKVEDALIRQHHIAANKTKEV